MTFQATKAAVPVRVTGPITDGFLNRGTPPDDFLEALVQWGARADAAIFAPNPLIDIYALVRNNLGGPWPSPLTSDTIPWLRRRAVMLEVLRVLGGFESSWTWEEGADPDGADESDPRCQETGIFQVSANSMDSNASLPVCVMDFCGAQDVETFIAQMKLQHAFAVEYCARLLRFDTSWDGPIDRGEVQTFLSMDAMLEFESLMAQAAGETGGGSAPVPASGSSGGAPPAFAAYGEGGNAFDASGR